MAQGFSALKKRTNTLKKKVTIRTNFFRRKLSSRSNLVLIKPSSRDLDSDETEDVVAELPLLMNTTRRTRRGAWGEEKVGNGHNINDFVLSSAVLARTFSEDTKSTASSELYQPSSKNSYNEGRIENPNIHKRDIFVRNDEDDDSVFQNLEDEDVINTSKTALPLYSISGSMLYKNIERGVIKEDSTKAANKIDNNNNDLTTSIARSSFLKSYAKDDSHYTNEMLQSNEDKDSKEFDSSPLLLNQLEETRKVAFALSSDSSEAGDVPNAIDRTDSKESAHSSVSSVTMYSTYQNDPLVRASNNLMDLLRSEKQPYAQQRYTQQPYNHSILSTNLYEA
eukprot:CAMPEP_0194248584 /NCGR_PEP_ID=MMETSP0158-20130606/18679_1 /TAXON_ID=33649 /ORGANISM="Thalassionema nitzschioides, Strain L26-B" /LENGTH=336 /DNA_ID=CAMNT_0038984921 /DNA_START=12 /DNA_END=1022 /DNA_ORIENTATION=+